MRSIDLGRHLKTCIFPAAATVVFLLLLLHESSDSPVVFNRYSVDYSTLLVLAALNLALLWQRSLLGFSYPALFSYGAVVVSFTFLFDFFVIGLNLPFFPKTEPGWGVLVLLASCLLQLKVFHRLIENSFTARLRFPFRRLLNAKGNDDHRISSGDSPQAIAVLASGQTATVPLPLAVNYLGTEQCRSSIDRRVEPTSNAILNAAMVGCSVMFVVILAELVLRFFLLETLTPKNRREFLHLMSLQWPEPISVTKPIHAYRILGLADSFGVMGGTSGNYHYLLEAALRREVSPAIQMVNVSVSGYEPRHELAIMRFGMAYAPDLVLHGFFVGNDFTLYGEDNYEYRGIRIENQPGISRYWPRHLLLADLIRNQIIRLRDLRQIEFEQRTGAVDQVGYLSRKFFLQMQLHRMIYLRKQSENEMKKVLPILASIRYVARKGGARYVMVIHPDQTQVDESLRREIIRTFQLREQDYDFDFPQKILASYCAGSGILCLDLLAGFRAKAKQGALYTISDGHYNLDGNKLAADNIRRFLLDSQLFRNIIGTSVSQAATGH